MDLHRAFIGVTDVGVRTVMLSPHDPHGPHEVRTGQDRSGTLQQFKEQIEFLRVSSGALPPTDAAWFRQSSSSPLCLRTGPPLPVPAGPTPIAGRAGVREFRPGPAHHRCDSRPQLPRQEGLGDVIIGRGLQSRQHIRLVFLPVSVTTSAAMNCRSRRSSSISSMSGSPHPTSA